MSVFTDEDCRPVQAQAVERTTENLNSIIVTERDVFHAIENIKVNKTPGPDKISPRILKEVKH